MQLPRSGMGLADARHMGESLYLIATASASFITVPIPDSDAELHTVEVDAVHEVPVHKLASRLEVRSKILLWSGFALSVLGSDGSTWPSGTIPEGSSRREAWGGGRVMVTWLVLGVRSIETPSS